MASERIARLYRQDAMVDPLTGVPNRRAFVHHGERLLRRARVERSPVALILFDLDRFKSINDRFGHSAGDHVLIAPPLIITPAEIDSFLTIFAQVLQATAG